MRVVLVAILAALVGCAQQPRAAAWLAAGYEPTPEQARNRATVEKYLAAQDPVAATACLAPSNHPRLLEWDTLGHPKRQILSAAVNDDAAIVTIHEDNDFSRLLGHPGWDGTVTYRFNADGLIEKSSFTPTPGKNPSWRAYMDAALPWLREHHAAELERVFPEGKLRQDGESARTWAAILRKWRAATGRPAV